MPSTNLSIKAQAAITSALLLFAISQKPFLGDFTFRQEKISVPSIENDLGMKYSPGERIPNETIDKNKFKQEAKDSVESALSAYAITFEKPTESTNPTPTHFPTPTAVTKQETTTDTSAAIPKHKNKVEGFISDAPDHIQTLVEIYAQEFGADRNLMLKIAKCESGYREEAVNGPYAGIYQFVSSTWVSNRKAMRLDPNPELRFNIEESVKTAAFKMGRDGYGAWPVCSSI